MIEWPRLQERKPPEAQILFRWKSRKEIFICGIVINWSLCFQGSMGTSSFLKPATFSFSPIGPAPTSSSSSYSAPVRPVGYIRSISSSKSWSNRSNVSSNVIKCSGGLFQHFQDSALLAAFSPGEQGLIIIFRITPSAPETWSASQAEDPGRADHGGRKLIKLHLLILIQFEAEPLRKVHLSEELVAQTMADLYISHPRPKVARRYVRS